MALNNLAPLAYEEWIEKDGNVIDRQQGIVTLLAAVERVKKLHQPDSVLPDYCTECSDFGSDQFPIGQLIEWPCATVRALTEGETSE